MVTLATLAITASLADIACILASFESAASLGATTQLARLAAILLHDWVLACTMTHLAVHFVTDIGLDVFALTATA